jgi:hypothetical protein
VEEAISRAVFASRAKICRLIYDVEVRKAVIVIIAPRETRTHVFREKPITRPAGMDEV